LPTSALFDLLEEQVAEFRSGVFLHGGGQAQAVVLDRVVNEQEQFLVRGIFGEQGHRVPAGGGRLFIYDFQHLISVRRGRTAGPKRQNFTGFLSRPLPPHPAARKLV
jgi:hypothetical protein